MPHSFDQWRLDIVVEEGAVGIPVIQDRIAGWPHVRLVVVPKGYTTPNGTRFKARANHYALIDRLPLDDEWAYHLDDDTAITRSTARGLARFIQDDDGTRHAAQGTLTALTFAQLYSQATGFLQGETIGASPSSVHDLVVQRRRWFAGLATMMRDRNLPVLIKLPIAYCLGNWALGLSQGLIPVMGLALVMGWNISPGMSWIPVIWGMSFSFQLWIYIEGVRINAMTEPQAWWYIPYMTTLVVLLIIPISLIEAWSGCLGFQDALRKKVSFVVIRKEQ